MMNEGQMPCAFSFAFNLSFIIPHSSISLHRLIGLRVLLRGFFGFQLGELLLGLHVAGLIAERGEPRVKRRL
jgi:hypothetical protein